MSEPPPRRALPAADIGAEEGARQVGVERVAAMRPATARDRPHSPRAGIVEGDVEPPKADLRRLDQGLRVGLVPCTSPASGDGLAARPSAISGDERVELRLPAGGRPRPLRPPSANSFAVARPMPELAPVTMAILPLSTLMYEPLVGEVQIADRAICFDWRRFNSNEAAARVGHRTRGVRSAAMHSVLSSYPIRQVSRRKGPEQAVCRVRRPLSRRARLVTIFRVLRGQTDHRRRSLAHKADAEAFYSPKSMPMSPAASAPMRAERAMAHVAGRRKRSTAG